MIHILTLSWNGLDKLKRLRSGLLKNLQQTGQSFKWHVKDNGSIDGTVSELSTWPEVTLLETGHNRDNFALGVNKLFQLSNSCPEDLLLLLNNDVEFADSTSLSHMIDLMTPGVGIVGARLLYPGTTKLQHAGVIFSERYGNMPYHYRHKEESDDNAKKNRYFQAVTAAVCLVKAEDFIAVNGLNEELFWAFEDIDLNLKIGQLGRKIIYCGQTEIYHEESATLQKNKLNKLFLSSNVTRFKREWTGKYELDHKKYLKNPNYNEA